MLPKSIATKPDPDGPKSMAPRYRVVGQFHVAVRVAADQHFDIAQSNHLTQAVRRMNADQA